MCAEAKQNDGEHQSRVLRHFTKWNPCYQNVGILSIVVVIIVGACSLRQTQEALELQRAEFMLRNRPLVVMGNPEFSDDHTEDSTGELFPRSLKVQLLNVSEIPATQVEGHMEARLNGAIVGTLAIHPMALAKGMARIVVVGLTEAAYSAAKDPANAFEIAITLTYSGMLGEETDQYSTRVDVSWSPADGVFLTRGTTYE